MNISFIFHPNSVCIARRTWLRVTGVPFLCLDGSMTIIYFDPGSVPLLHCALIHFCWNKKISTLLAVIIP